MKKMLRNSIIIVAVILLGVIFLYLVGPIVFPDDVLSEIYTVNDENDDGRTFTVELGETGYGNEYETWALLQLSPSYSFGLKLDNISIPQGTTIEEAYIQLYSIGTPGHQNPNCIIYCDDVDNAVDFSVLGVLNISGRNYTNNSVVWNTTTPYGEWVKTPSLVNPLQEIIDRKNWTSGNSLAFLFVTKGLRWYSAAFNNYDTGYPAKLYVEWKEFKEI